MMANGVQSKQLQVALISSTEATISEFEALCSRFKYVFTCYAANTPDLLTQIQQTFPNIIFIDDEDTTGPDVVRVLRSSSKIAEIPFIYCSSTASVEQRKTAYQLGAADYIQMPFLPEELVSKIERSLLYQSELELAKSTQRLLQQAAEDQMHAIDMLAHDLKSPVSVLWSATDILELELPKADLDSLLTELNFLLDPMRDNLRRMREMIDTLLSNRHNTDNQKQFISLQKLLAEAHGELSLRARIKQIDYTWQGPEPDFEIFADVNGLRHVLQNLLSNALKYTPEGGRVELAAMLVSPTTVRIQVQDNGKGIPPEDIAMVFDRYYRAKQHRVQGKTNRELTGIGLGLAIAKSIVRKHNGKIWVESTVGQGSTFIVEIPITS
jgi:signal transduction histidine kinase